MRAIGLSRLWTNEGVEPRSVPFKGCDPSWKAADYEMIWIIVASVSSIDGTEGVGHGFESYLDHAHRLVSISRNNISISRSIYPVLCVSGGN